MIGNEAYKGYLEYNAKNEAIQWELIGVAVIVIVLLL